MRRVRSIAVVPIACFAISCSGFSQTAGSPAEFRTSLSISPFTELVFRDGITYADENSTARDPRQLQQMFVRHGANEVYARIATTHKYRKGFGDHSMDRGLDRARIAGTLGVPFNPELGLFNIYGDIRCQPPPDFSDYPQIKAPADWTALTLDQMLPVLRSYGAIAAREILDTGVKVRIWDLGNEIEFGTAGVAIQPIPGGCDDTAGGRGWYKPPNAVDPAIGKMSATQLMKMPERERIDWLKAHLWPYEAKLLAAVAAGIRSVDTGARFSTHVSGLSAVLPTFATAFYQAMRDAGFVVDELGFSYYPTSSARPADRLKAFKDTATAAYQALGKPVFIAEFGYPAARMERGFIWNDAVPGYALTDEGQAAFIRDLASWGRRSGVLSGIRPWAPDLAMAGWVPMSFFAIEGKTAKGRPALDAISEGLQQRQ